MHRGLLRRACGVAVQHHAAIVPKTFWIAAQHHAAMTSSRSIWTAFFTIHYHKIRHPPS